MADNILDLIDSAVRDWEISGDAMRWRPDLPAPMKETFTQVRFETRPADLQPVSLRMLGFAADFERQMAALTQTERDEFTAYWRAGPYNFEQAFHAWRWQRMMEPIEVALSAWAEQLTTALRSMQGPIAAFARTPLLRLEPWPQGCNEPCFCHPAPFPAARDYRRRTKHRNRRRR